MIDIDKLRALHEAVNLNLHPDHLAAARFQLEKFVKGPDFPALLAMAEENARLREDAARYHWLRDDSCPPHNFYIAVPDEFHGVKYAACEVDAYIDEARALGKDRA